MSATKQQVVASSPKSMRVLTVSCLPQIPDYLRGMQEQFDELNRELEARRLEIETLQMELAALREGNRILKARLKQSPSDVAAERDVLRKKYALAKKMIATFLEELGQKIMTLPESDDELDPLEIIQEAHAEDDHRTADGIQPETVNETVPSEASSSILPLSPPQSAVKPAPAPSTPSRTTDRSARQLPLSPGPSLQPDFEDYYLYFADKPPRPVKSCSGPYTLEHLHRALDLDRDTFEDLQDLCTVSDLHPRIFRTDDNMLFFYHPIVFETNAGDESTSYFIDWGKNAINSRLENYILDSDPKTSFHIFVLPSKKSDWYYYGAHQLEVMDAGSLDVWAQLLARDDQKEAILNHIRIRSRMGDVDVAAKIETDELVQIALEIGAPKKRTSEEMRQRLG
ncbi:hypothetical protein BDZ89DRAFT_1066102 [Hymenopellis radicata]|nr:hypothetical protein BDZ89DRAFT_1066102 [Hymenopellis radicata]